MKIFIKLILLFFTPIFSMAQTDPTWGYLTEQQVDSLKRTVELEKNDTLRMAAYRSLGFYYQEAIPDSGLYYHEKQLALAKKLKMKLWEADAYSQTGFTLVFALDWVKAYEYHTEAMKLASDEKSEADNWRPWTFSNSKNSHEARISILGMNYQMMGNLWGFLGDREKQKSYYLEGAKLGESINNGKVVFQGYNQLVTLLPPDSAMQITNKALKFAEASNFPRIGGALMKLSLLFADKEMWDSAYVFAQKSITNNRANNNLNSLVGSYRDLTLLFARQNKKDSSLYYATKTLETSRITGVARHSLYAYKSLSIANQLNNAIDSAFKYEQLAYNLNDSLKDVRIKNLTNYQKISFDEQLRLKELDEQKTAYANNLKMIGLLAMLGGILLVAFILYRNNRQKQKANGILQEQKDKVESTLHELKSTQAQLIQTEKMASLGELTAGIAHEIKNPLNFVNNFSEVSIEMIGEVIDSRLKTQDTRPKTEADEIEDEILEDIKANLEKIHEHGSRANGIVTSMLQHSRGGSGKKEPTDLNALIKEYVNLSFHGMRAGKNPIDVEIALELDDTIKEIPLVREDFTRVIINLCNNAFDAMRGKTNSEFIIHNSEFFHPKLTVRTKSEKDHILISVEDNGHGIPDEIKDKILQPFFTTKKGTEGTGLGLSITHDIIKAHGGELRVESKYKGGQGEENTFAKFTIQLPL